jgi:anti-anti-sigma factor
VPIDSRQFADTVVATPEGRIDHRSAAEFEAALEPLLALPGAGLVLDLSRVDYISSVGLRVLLIGAKRRSEQQSKFVVAELRGVVAEIFAISRFDRILTVCPTLEAALEHCSPAALAAYRAGAAAA